LPAKNDDAVEQVHRGVWFADKSDRRTAVSYRKNEDAVWQMPPASGSPVSGQ
jgi:hypothetical protein